MSGDEFDIPSKGATFPLNPFDGDGHYLTTDKTLYRWDSTRSKWLSDQLFSISFTALGEGVAANTPIHLTGGSDNAEDEDSLRAEALPFDCTIVSATVVRSNATSTAHDIDIGTIQAGSLLTDDYLTVEMSAGGYIDVFDNLNHDQHKTNMDVAPNTSALSCRVNPSGAEGAVSPNNVKVTVYFRRNPAYTPPVT